KGVGRDVPCHCDSNAYCSKDYCGVKDLARGFMRTYLILKEKAACWNRDKEIHAILQEISGGGNGSFQAGPYSTESATKLLAHVFDKDAISKKRLPYDCLDPLTVDLISGLR